MTVSEVLDLMTPESVLEQVSFKTPKLISPIVFECFEHLYEYRKNIMNLELVPIKDDKMYQKYHLLDKEQAHVDLLKEMGDRNIVALRNQFPYWLPDDIDQKIVWIKNDTSHEEVVKFLQQYDHSNTILFERSTVTVDKLVKGTFKQMRHIHLWQKSHI